MRDADLYSFVYRAILTEEALDKAGRRRRSHFGPEGAQALQRSLSFDYLDSDLLAEAQRMSIVYAALHSFENAVRTTVTKAMLEEHGESWWEKVPDRIRRTATSRMEEDSKHRWHGARGATEINYCDFSD